MKERPILFSAPMVRAILDGRKTQTRRYLTSDTNFTCAELTKLKCRYGVPGDRLWVRETWCAVLPRKDGGLEYNGARLVTPPDGESVELWYRADGELGPISCLFDDGPRWRPSLHMPRWASRLTLEVTSVRVERLQDISEEDAKAEGVTPLASIGESQPILDTPRRGRTHGTHPHVLAFGVLWDTLNGKRPGCAWQDNPWVWAVSFRRIGDGDG